VKGALLFVILLVVWLLWSGLFKPLVVGLGVASCLLCVLLTHRMRRHGPEVFDLAPVLRATTYLPWLLKEIAVSSWNVMRVVLNPRLPIEPVVIHLRSSQRTQLGRVIYANSITLTPGTLTMDEDGEHLTVHALTAADARALQVGEMDVRVSRLERPE
jgi:multicomponent Na+:H+ antiporter subunit E